MITINTIEISEENFHFLFPKICLENVGSFNDHIRNYADHPCQKIYSLKIYVNWKTRLIDRSEEIWKIAQLMECEPILYILKLLKNPTKNYKKIMEWSVEYKSPQIVKRHFQSTTDLGVAAGKIGDDDLWNFFRKQDNDFEITKVLLATATGNYEMAYDYVKTLKYFSGAHACDLLHASAKAGFMKGCQDGLIFNPAGGLRILVVEGARNSHEQICRFAIDAGFDDAYTLAVNSIKSQFDWGIDKCITMKLSKIEWCSILYYSASALYEHGFRTAITKCTPDWNMLLNISAQSSFESGICEALKNGADNWEIVSCAAAKNGHINLLREAIDNGAKNWDDILENSALGCFEKGCKIAMHYGACDWKTLRKNAGIAGFDFGLKLAFEHGY